MHSVWPTKYMMRCPSESTGPEFDELWHNFHFRIYLDEKLLFWGLRLCEKWEDMQVTQIDEVSNIWVPRVRVAFSWKYLIELFDIMKDPWTNILMLCV